MSDVVIRVDGVGKRYRIGGKQERYKTFRDAIVRTVRAPLDRLAARRDNENNTFWALNDVSFEVKRGEVLGIIGRNGAGKSTLLKILSRITEPTAGAVYLKGRVGALLEVGTGFHPELTGRENIYLSGTILGMTRAEIARKFDEIVHFAGVEQFIDTPVKRYSSGMGLRLGFAVAAHLEPEVLIIDEVLAVGDAEFQKKCLGKMREVAQSGRTVLFVSHQLGAIERLCTRVIWLDSGTIRKNGSTQEIISAYLVALSSGAFVPQMRGPIQINQVLLQDGAGNTTTVFNPGDDIDIQVHYSADRLFEDTQLWISINSQWGPVCAANMFLDGHVPEQIRGNGYIGCRFKRIPLLPQTYWLQMAIRNRNGSQTLFETQEVGSFDVTGSLSDYGLAGERADILARESTPFVHPYEWYYADGKTFSVQITSKNVGDHLGDVR